MMTLHKLATIEMVTLFMADTKMHMKTRHKMAEEEDEDACCACVLCMCVVAICDRLTHDKQ